MTSSHLTFSQKEELKDLQLKMQQEEIVELSKKRLMLCFEVLIGNVVLLVLMARYPLNREA